MKYEIFDGEPEEKTVYFRLRRYGDGIMLFACDHTGQVLPQGNICKITKDGYLALCQNIGGTIGLKLDGRASIIIKERS